MSNLSTLLLTYQEKVCLNLPTLLLTYLIKMSCHKLFELCNSLIHSSVPYCRTLCTLLEWSRCSVSRILYYAWFCSKLLIHMFWRAARKCVLFDISGRILQLQLEELINLVLQYYYNMEIHILTTKILIKLHVLQLIRYKQHKYIGN